MLSVVAVRCSLLTLTSMSMLGVQAESPAVAERRGDTLLNTMLLIEMYTLNRAWTDLTEEEFFWEPLAGTWSVRQRSECQTPTPFSAEDWVADLT